MPPMERHNNPRLNICIERPLHDLLRKHAQDRDMSLQQLGRRALMKELVGDEHLDDMAYEYSVRIGHAALDGEPYTPTDVDRLVMAYERDCNHRVTGLKQ